MPSTFETLEREKSFRHPPQNGASVPILNEFVTPHLESFNALFDDSGLPLGDGDGKGLLSLALKDIGERVVFSGTGAPGGEGSEKAWGTRMRSEFVAYIQLSSILSGIGTSLDRASHNSSANGFGQGQNRKGTKGVPFRGPPYASTKGYVNLIGTAAGTGAFDLIQRTNVRQNLLADRKPWRSRPFNHARLWSGSNHGPGAFRVQIIWYCV